MMEPDNTLIIDQLAGFPVLKDMGPDQLAKVAHFCKVQNFDEGDPIIQRGDKDNWIYFLVNGKVNVRRDGEEVTTLKAPGDLFGEMRAIDGAARAASVTAAEATTCLAVDVARLNRLAKDEKTALGSVLYKVFALLLTHRLRHSDEEISRLKKENASLKSKLEKKNLEH